MLKWLKYTRASDGAVRVYARRRKAHSCLIVEYKRNAQETQGRSAQAKAHRPLVTQHCLRWLSAPIATEPQHGCHSPHHATSLDLHQFQPLPLPQPSLPQSSVERKQQLREQQLCTQQLCVDADLSSDLPAAVRARLRATRFSSSLSLSSCCCCNFCCDCPPRLSSRCITGIRRTGRFFLR